MKIKETKMINKPPLHDHTLSQVPQLMFEYRTFFTHIRILDVRKKLFE